MTRWKAGRSWAAVAACALCLAAGPQLDVERVSPVPHGRYPCIVYWFWQESTVAGKQYLKDIDRMATRSPFDLAFLTERGPNFYDFPRMHAPFAETVAAAHARHLKVGLQLWGEFYPKVDPEEAQSLVTEGTVTLDAAGRGTITETTVEVRKPEHAPTRSGLLRVYAFTPAGAGQFVPGSVQDITPMARGTSDKPGTLTVEISGGAALAGKTACVLVNHALNFPDLFGTKMVEHLASAVEAYKDIPFDGAGLDEFGYMMLKPQRTSPLSERIGGAKFAPAFEAATSASFARTLFDMRYAPADDPTPRVVAINRYFDHLRAGPQRTEFAFRDLARKAWGKDIFIGVHNTYHNSIYSDDVWRTGINYWQQPRDFGQSDENLPLPQRVGILFAHPEPIEYDMWYSKDLNSFGRLALENARYGSRMHYHGWNDTGKWGQNLQNEDVLASIGPVEAKIRLLDLFDPAPPDIRTLAVFGLPAHFNAFSPDLPGEGKLTTWGVNGAMNIEKSAGALWKAGDLNALVSSDLIDTGAITLGADARPVLNGHAFDHLLFMYPQYAKETTLAFLERYVAAGGKLILAGHATRDFEGKDIRARFAALVARAAGISIAPADVEAVFGKPIAIPGGATLADGSVVLTDVASVKSGAPVPFNLTLGGHAFAGAYVGVCAIKVTASGEIEKLAAGGFTSLTRDGQTILKLSAPSDLVLKRGPDGKPHVLIERADAAVETFTP